MKAEDNIMEMIWNGIPKIPDDTHITLTQDDIEDIWENGFVDTEQFPCDTWVKAFEPHISPEGHFVLTLEEFLEKDSYRYTGEIFRPFEPLFINEGKYTDTGLQELVDMSIEPSCSYSRQKLDNFFKKWKKKYRDASDNLIVMDIDAKREIAKLVYENPSPMRRRELIFEALFTGYMADIADGNIVISATAGQAAQVQISTFTTQVTTGESALKKLKSIEKTKAPKATGTGDEGVKVKKVRRSRKGRRG